MARSSRLNVWRVTDRPNSSQTRCARSISRQRTTPCAAGIGPVSTCSASRARCSSFRVADLPGALRVARPSGPSALKRSTQSRTICSVTPASFAASLLLPAVQDQRDRQQTADLTVISASARHPAQLPGRPIPSNLDCRAHREPPSARAGESDNQPLGNPITVSHTPRPLVLSRRGRPLGRAALAQSPGTRSSTASAAKAAEIRARIASILARHDRRL